MRGTDTLMAADPPPTSLAGAVGGGEFGDDASLVRGCRQGDGDAWAALLEKYKRLVYSIPIKYGLSQDQATDIFQDVCLELLSELPRLREPRALPKWLMQVTAHKCAHLKRSWHERLASEPGDGGSDLGTLPDGSRLSEDVLLEVEREQALRDAVSALSPRCRKLVSMLFYESPPRPYRQIAESLEISCGSIGFIRGRCLERLRTHLQKHGFRGGDPSARHD